MTIDINLLRVSRGGDPERVRASEKTRGRSGSVVDTVIAVDEEWRKNVFEMEAMKKDMNALVKRIGERKKANREDQCTDLVEKTGKMKEEIPRLELIVAETEKKRDTLLKRIGNLVHSSVVPGVDESKNQVIKSWGNIIRNGPFDGSPGKMHHHQLMARLGMVDLKRGVKIAGHRGYFLQGFGVLLNMALINYGLKFLMDRNYQPVQPPYLMRKDVMAETAELADFNESLYRISGSTGSDETDCSDSYLIATSEQPISALYRGEFLEPRSLPKRFAGISTCFRKEAGSHGKDVWGLFRVHQFEKVEQFCIGTPESADALHEEMILTAEEFYKSLGLPYRVVSIVAGALNDAASKKYDLEAWFPGYEDYRELVSCSNCLDYQSRALNVRLGHPKQGDREKQFVYMLNGTLVATERAMCCIMENYQTEKGVKIPEPLRPYMNNIDFLPFEESTPDNAKATDKNV